MIDVHTHTLPGIDDGSRSVKESVEMLTALAQQGVTMVAATPHFYAMQLSPEQFLARREKAAEQLQAAQAGHMPMIFLGAETLYFDGISQAQLPPQLKIGRTPLFLLEMPFSPWSDRWLREIIAIGQREDTVVLLAHIDRYLHFTTYDVLRQLLSEGILFQANADFFLRLSTRRRALGMLRDGMIHFLGSDCHNTTSRAPNMASALTVIRKKLGNPAIAYLEEMQRRYFGSAEVSL